VDSFQTCTILVAVKRRTANKRDRQGLLLFDLRSDDADLHILHVRNQLLGLCFSFRLFQGRLYRFGSYDMQDMFCYPQHIISIQSKPV
jgi:hypothetical protein